MDRTTPQPDLRAALAVASSYPVFPLLGKTPAISNAKFSIPRGAGGCKLAARDPEEVRRLWSMAQESQPSAEEFSLGVATGRASGLLVIDADDHKVPPSDMPTHRQLLHDILGDAARVHLTQSGGRHYIYALPEDAPPIKNLPISPYIDVRSDAGYVVWPPSAGYTVEHDIKPPPYGLDKLARLQELQARHRRSSGGGNNLSDLSSDELTDMIQRGVNLHESLFALAQSCAREGMAEADAVGVCRKALARSERRLSDPETWDDRMRDLNRTVADAYARAGLQAEEVATRLAGLLQKRAPPAAQIAVTSGGCEATNDQLAGTRIDPIDWLVPNLLPAQNLVSVTGPSGVGKTRWTAALVAAMAAGRTDLLRLPDAARPLRAAWFGNEEKTADLLRRVKGAVQVIGPDVLQSEPVYYRGKDAAGGPLRLLKQDGEENTKLVDALIATLRGFRADVAIFDPMISLGVEDENASSSVAALMRAFLRLINGAGCAVMFIHHSPKDRNAAPDQLRGDYAAWRGSGAIYSTLDVGLTLMPWVPAGVHAAGKAEIKRMQGAVREGLCPKFVVADMAKQREGQELRSQVWEIVDRELGDGQGSVGVMRVVDEDAASQAVTRALQSELSRSMHKALVGIGRIQQADLMEAMVEQGERTLRHVSVPRLIEAGVLPQGSRADTANTKQMTDEFAEPIGTKSGNAVRLERDARGRLSIVLTVEKA